MKLQKYRNSNSSIVTRDLEKLIEQTGNLYASVAIISKRAGQIATKMKEELSNKLSDFASAVDSLEEVHENKEQIEISRSYEKLPKATTIAAEEFLEKKLNFRYKETNPE